MYECKILADSISPKQHRLTTFQVTFPRFILAEVNTHRRINGAGTEGYNDIYDDPAVLSRNSASSRAIPTEKLIDTVRSFPFIPDFNRRAQGMGVGEPLGPIEQADRVMSWDRSREAALTSAQEMLDLDKSRVNRLLEPFMWHTAILSGTDWSNFFALRTDKNAQPEFRTIAEMMLEAYHASTPNEIGYGGELHLPLVTANEILDESMSYADPWVDWDMWKKVSIGRCARVSYLTHDGIRDLLADISLYERLRTNGHLSPFEHVARPFNTLEWGYVINTQWHIRHSCNDYAGRLPEMAERMCKQLEYCGNFRGWYQMRYDIPNQDDLSKQI